jgi:UDP-N-acetylglucosamine--N-acetylmuramyl-(pentapeptide) pyrophosphoryl-undecaprenol N-acetylglucosamine transferase
LRLYGGYRTARAILKRVKPLAVIGFGGYPSFPPIMAASRLKIPSCVHDQNAVMGRANRVLARWADAVASSFPELMGLPPEARGKLTVTGNPVRREISQLPAPVERYRARSGPLNVLIIGGSLGAKILNDVVPAAIAKLPTEQRPHIVHQSGRAHIAALKDSYTKAGIDAEVVDFIDDMAARYAAADLVICRAGAITVTELCAAGVASVLVPLVVSTTSHQRNNAQWMEKGQAGIHMPQPDLKPDALATLLQTLTRERCLQMAEAAYAQGRRDANEAIALVLEELGTI